LNSSFVSRSAYSAERLQNILNLQVAIFTDNFIIKFIVMITGIASNFHGDLQFDNILLKEDDDFLILDWRQIF